SDPENLRGREVLDQVLQIRNLGAQAFGEFRPHDPWAAVAVGAAARCEGSGASLDRGRIFHRQWWLVDRMAADRGAADILQCPRDDVEVRLGCGDIVEAAEEEYCRGHRNDDCEGADKAEKSHGKTSGLSGAAQVQVNREGRGWRVAF